MNEKDLIILPMDAVVYLAKHFSIHTHQVSMLIRNNVFKQKDPMRIIRDMESAEYFYKEYQKQKQSRTAPKKPVFTARPLHIRKGFPLTITEPNGQKLTFNYKREIHSYFAARYKRKASTVNHLIRNALVFWTTDVLSIIKNIPRADAYYHAYLRNAPRFRPEDLEYRARPQKNRPAYDGGYHMEKKPKVKVQSSLESSETKKFVAQRKKQFPYHTLPPLKEMPPFSYALDYVFKDDLEQYKAQREAIKYIAEAFSLTPKSIDKHFSRNIYFSDDPVFVANDLKGAHANYADYLHDVKEGARMKLLRQAKAAHESPKVQPEFGSMLETLTAQRTYKTAKIKDARQAIERLQKEIDKETSEIQVLDTTIDSLTLAQKIFQP